MDCERSPFLFPKTLYSRSLESWAANIQACPEAQQCCIEQITHYKAVSDMEHEFLVVSARHPSGSMVVIGVDRNAEEGIEHAVESSVSSRYFLNAITKAQTSSSSSSSSFLGSTPAGPPVDAAFDSVQVSHDGTPAPILARHGATLPLNTLTFPSPARPNLLQFSVLLLVIRADFPSYILLKHQCYFFARSTLLSLAVLFAGVETPHPENFALQATWRGAHVSLFEAGKTAVQNMLLLPLVEFPALIVPAGLFAIYSVVRLYDGHTVSNADERRKINDEKITKHGIVVKYREAWAKFVSERVEGANITDGQSLPS